MSLIHSADTAVFDKQLKFALKNYYKPERLTEESPLAAPYFLGEAWADQIGRGEALQQLIRDAADTLWGGERAPRGRTEIENALNEILQEPNTPRYSYLILELRYLRRFFKPRSLKEIWEDFLGESRAEFYRDIDAAVERLGEQMLQRVQPTFRPERPQLAGPLIGRSEAVQAVLEPLRQGQSVSLTGSGGMGKTTLGVSVAERWQELYGASPVFWFTVRPTLNDQLSGLLFSLGYFFNEHGASALWRKLTADGGKIENEHLILGIVREDLATLVDKRPLLCFDEVDRLWTPNPDQPNPDHVQLLEFIDSLRGQVPLLLIGQRGVLDSEGHVALDGLAETAVTAWLAQVGIQATADEIAQLHRYTAGNPRLCQMCMALRQDEESLRELLVLLPRTPALPPLLDRLWQRTSTAERQFLQVFSVFRSTIPADGWAGGESALDSLLARRVVQADGRGGLTMWPALQELIYREMTAEQREQYHVTAAAVRAARGEVTSTAYHYWQAGWLKEAIQSWYPYREQEIQRGQGAAALAVFQEISQNRLKKKEREALALLRAELYQLSGDNRQGLTAVRDAEWSPERETSVNAKLLEGYFLNALGYPDEAAESYEQGLLIVMRLLKQLVKFRDKRSRAFLQQRQMGEAWKEARLAQYEAENLQGVVQTEQGDYSGANQSYQSALALAQSLGYEPGLAQTHRDLAILRMCQFKLDDAIAHANEAIIYYEQIGDQLNIATIQNTLSGIYLQAQRFKEAAEAARAALTFFERIHHSYSMAVTASNLAEAYFELGDLENAEKYAHYVLGQEEIQSYPYGLFTLGSVKRARQDLPAAEKAYGDAAEIAQKNGDKFMVAYAQRALGEVLCMSGQTDRGLSALRDGLKLFAEMGIAEEQAKTEGLITAVEETIG